MVYSVSARLIPSTAGELYRKLTDGTIAEQKPDGRELVESMERARLMNDGTVRWSEVCYCPTPLAHERATVLDHYFTDLETEQIDDYVQFEGKALMDVLAAAAGSPRGRRR